MLLFNKKLSQKTKGQAMAEFALTIPVFLLLVFGIIELSRFFLVYSSVFTAVREATRYGSSVGDQANPNYQNCEMIAETAVRMGNFGGVQTDDVIVFFESEPGIWVADCDPDDDPEDRYQPILGDRVVVEIDTAYDSLLGAVPDLTVSAENGRTIMLGVNNQVAVINTVNPGGTPTTAPTQTDVPTSTPEPTSTPNLDPTPTSTTEPTNMPSSTPVTPVVCPSQSLSFNGNLVTNNNPAYARINIKNVSAYEYKLVSIENVNWNLKQGNTNRYISNINWNNNQIIWDPMVNQNPPIVKINMNDNVSIGANINQLPITFNFSSQPNNINLKFTLNFLRADGNCPISLSVGY